MFFELGVTGLTPFGIFRVAPLCKILLCLHRKNEFLIALRADQNPRLESIHHVLPHSIFGKTLLPCKPLPLPEG